MMNLSKTKWLAILLIVAVCVAGFFAFQWWQVKGELGKQIEALQKALKETAEWETYKNKEYGFEIDYPAVGWEIEEGHYRGASPFVFDFYKLSSGEERFLYFYINGAIWFMSPRCEDSDWREIINNIFDCTDEQIYGMNFEKEVTADSGAKGYQVKVRDPRGEMRGVFFPFSGLKLVLGDEILSRAFILFTYYLEPEPAPEEIEIFDHVISTFRFIGE